LCVRSVLLLCSVSKVRVQLSFELLLLLFQLWLEDTVAETTRALAVLTLYSV